MTLPDPVAIIGLGLMGGSLARDLTERGVRVLGYDPDAEVAAAALASGSVHERLDPTLTGAASAELVVIAAPVDQTPALLSRLSAVVAPEALLSDLGSTKATIVAHAARIGLGARFVGAHPLAGDHRSGWQASRSGLYRGAPIFICPGPESEPEAVARVEEFWNALGGRCERIDPAEHDRWMAWISHLPQIASSAVAGSIRAGGFPPERLGSGGRDVTRLAASSPTMWSAICLANRDPIREALDDLVRRLEGVRDALGAGDADAILDFFRQGKEWIG